MRRKLTALVLAGATLVAFTGCGSDTTTTTAAVTTAAETTVAETTVAETTTVEETTTEEVTTEEATEAETGVNTAEVVAAEGNHAFLGIQSDGNWAFRNTYSDKNYGLNGEDDQAFNYISSNVSEGIQYHEVMIRDAVITGDGEYSVKIAGYDFSENAQTMNLLFVDTDIPADSEATFSDIKVYIDGAYVNTFEYFESPDDAKSNNTKTILLCNIWNSDIEESTSLLSSNLPRESVEIKFTVSGM